jgi:hypothetical protein
MAHSKKEKTPEIVRHRDVVRNFACTFLFSASAFCASAVETTEPVAMISDCVGESSILVGGDTSACEILTNLSPGTRLKLATGDRVTVVYFDSGKEFAFEDQADVRIGEKAPVSTAGSSPKIKELAIVRETGLAPSRRRDVAQAAIVLRGNGRKKISLFNPKDTTILEPRPTFRWGTIGSETRYRFRLIDESGQIVIEIAVDGTEFKMPLDAKIQEEIFYTWEVEARTPTGVVYSSSADFSVLASAERARLERLRPGPDASVSERVVFATVLEQMNLLEAAKRYWKDLASERPDDSELQARRTRAR